MELKQCILTKNDCYKKATKITPKGIIVHSTGANNPTLRRYVQPDDGILGVNKNKNDWNRSGISVCVHAFIGKDKDGKVRVYQTLPFNYACWGIGAGKKGSYNYDPTGYIQFEMCEDDLKNETYFNEVMQNAIEFCAYLCKTYNLNVDNVISHHEGYLRGYGSNHSDCDHWLKKFGKDMNWFRIQVRNLVEDKPVGNYYIDNVDYEGANVRYLNNNKTTGQVLQIGTKVNVIKITGNKACITDNTYVDKSLISKSMPKIKVVTGADSQGLNVRNKPTTIMSKKIAIIKNGTKVKVYATKGSWSKISPNSEAWCSSNYIK